MVRVLGTTPETRDADPPPSGTVMRQRLLEAVALTRPGDPAHVARAR
ncbi:hypothetical protein J2X02_002930 [Pseudoxanthomonas japonensis]|nr:hypothetical protein [Pseudoxanthomonas japonensis]